MLAMIALLRSLPLAQVSISILPFTISGTLVLNHFLGPSVTLTQGIGIALIFGGAVLLNL